MSTDMKQPCCDEFAEATGTLLSLAGGGMMYPESLRPDAQMEYDEEGGVWHVNGCCGGGCHVLTGLRFCPWCGASIAGKKENQ